MRGFVRWSLCVWQQTSCLNASRIHTFPVALYQDHAGNLHHTSIDEVIDKCYIGKDNRMPQAQTSMLA